jgi:hypothetical protein
MALRVVHLVVLEASLVVVSLPGGFPGAHEEGPSVEEVD